MAPSVEGTASLWRLSLPLCLHRRVSHCPSLHPASSVATERKPGVRHPESGELRQHGDQRLHRQLRLHPGKVRDWKIRGWLCYHGNTQVCPVFQEKGHCAFFFSSDIMFRYTSAPMTTSTPSVAMPTSSSFFVKFKDSVCSYRKTFVSFLCLVSGHVCVLFSSKALCHIAVSSEAVSLCVLQCLRVRGPEDRGDGEDVEGGAAGESQTRGEQSEWPAVVLQSLDLNTF